MTDYTIPCETLVRLMAVINNDDDDPYFRTVRIDGGAAVATYRSFLVCEKIGTPVNAPVIHILNDAVLIAQCREEAKWGSSLVITAIPELQFATAVTTMGYKHPHNVCLWSPEGTKLDQWRSVVARVQEPSPASQGAMYLNVDYTARLVVSSPSGRVVFEENIDANRGALVCDSADPNWFAVIASYPADDASATPAAIPGWYK